MADLLESLQKVKRQRVHEQIAANIQELIVESGLEPGTRLPSEREFAQQLGVSRATVSEALRVLEQRGLIQRKVGDGTYVSNGTRSAFVDSMGRLFLLESCSYEDLMVYREMLEPDIAALAARYVTPEELAVIKELMERAETAHRQGDAETHVSADAEFHLALARASRNELAIATVAGIQGLLRSVLDAQYRVSADSDGILSHRPIYAALMAHDPEGARSAMVNHLHCTRDALRRVISELGTTLA